MPSVSIMGIGRMGGALAIALTDAGYAIDHLVHRGQGTYTRIASRLLPSTSVASLASIPELRSDIVLITTGDPEIASAAAQLAPRLRHRPVVLHTSGSLAFDVLADLASAGCPTGSMHPLVSISDAISGSKSFRDVYFCIEGDETAQAVAGEMVRALGGRPFSIEAGRKPLYHAAAVTAAGHVTALVDIAILMLSKCGIDRARAQRILLPLVKSTIANLENQMPSDALTGTFARADVAAFERHLNAMEEVSEAVREIYLLLGEHSVALTADNGGDAGELARLREAISIAKRKSEC